MIQPHHTRPTFEDHITPRLYKAKKKKKRRKSKTDPGDLKEEKNPHWKRQTHPGLVAHGWLLAGTVASNYIYPKLEGRLTKQDNSSHASNGRPPNTSNYLGSHPPPCRKGSLTCMYYIYRCAISTATPNAHPPNPSAHAPIDRQTSRPPAQKLQCEGLVKQRHQWHPLLSTSDSSRPQAGHRCRQASQQHETHGMWARAVEAVGLYGWRGGERTSEVGGWWEVSDILRSMHACTYVGTHACINTTRVRHGMDTEHTHSDIADKRQAGAAHVKEIDAGVAHRLHQRCGIRQDGKRHCYMQCSASSVQQQHHHHHHHNCCNSLHRRGTSTYGLPWKLWETIHTYLGNRNPLARLVVSRCTVPLLHVSNMHVNT
jgi:hypothetical protein